MRGYRLQNGGLYPVRYPPMSTAQWLSEFEKYKTIPEFLAENPDMDLAGFKFIYFMEWSHRQLGRFIGLAYMLPLLLFWMQGKLEHGKKWRFFSILLLIGFQGFLGWWMVSSGLGEGRVDVSQYRLAIHLGMALLILAMLQWTWLDQKQDWPPADMAPKFKNRTTVCFCSYIYKLSQVHLWREPMRGGLIIPGRLWTAGLRRVAILP